MIRAVVWERAVNVAGVPAPAADQHNVLHLPDRTVRLEQRGVHVFVGVVPAAAAAGPLRAWRWSARTVLEQDGPNHLGL